MTDSKRSQPQPSPYKRKVLASAPGVASSLLNPANALLTLQQVYVDDFLRLYGTEDAKSVKFHEISKSAALAFYLKHTDLLKFETFEIPAVFLTEATCEHVPVMMYCTARMVYIRSKFFLTRFQKS